MKNKNILLLFVIPILLSSCANKDYSSRVIYLSGKFKLTNAAFSDNYNPTSDPPYFSRIPYKTDCKELFDLGNSYVIYNVKMINHHPVGYGNKNISDKTSDYFEYVCNYDKVYGGVIKQTKDTKIDFVGVQSCRMHYWWTRMECWFPEIENGRRIILEFSISEYYEEPPEFDYTINL